MINNNWRFLSFLQVFSLSDDSLSKPEIIIAFSQVELSETTFFIPYN